MSEYRPIAGFDGYAVSADRVVWSVGREVRTKNGATRLTAAKPLKPDEKGRVALRRDGQTFKVRVDELARREFPPKRHLILERLTTLHCQWCDRDFPDFVTDYCSEDDRGMWPDLYRCPYCTTAVVRLPHHFPRQG